MSATAICPLPCMWCAGIFETLCELSAKVIQDVLVLEHGDAAGARADLIYEQMDASISQLVSGLPQDSTHFQWRTGMFIHFVNRKDGDGRKSLPYVRFRGMQVLTLTPCGAVTTSTTATAPSAHPPTCPSACLPFCPSAHLPIRHTAASTVAPPHHCSRWPHHRHC